MMRRFPIPSEELEEAFIYPLCSSRKNIRQSDSLNEKKEEKTPTINNGEGLGIFAR